ncbi:MAG: Thiol-disulfide oxidoreductase ResA [Planctomycetota bacterium]|jgi:thiol-disulfide isomerase/thioredoxin
MILRPGSTARPLLITVSLLGIAAGAMMVARGFLPTRTLAPAPAAPVIAFEPATLQMGELTAEAPKTVAVTLRNISARTIRITAAIANCGCTTSTFPPDPIPAGGTAEALVTVNAPATQDESLMKSVTFVVEGAEPVSLTVLGHVMKSAPGAVAPPTTVDSVEELALADRPTVSPPATKVATPAAPVAPPVQRPITFARVNPPIQPGARVSFPSFASWVKGTPITSFTPGKVYVFEFFSTSCSHCKEFAELITRLARTYGAQGAEFIAITDEEAPVVKAWLDQPGKLNEVPYSVVSDPDRSAMITLQNGTFRNFNPRFFVIKNGIVQWFGHPKEAEEPIAKVVAGTWDPETVRAAAITDSTVSRGKDLLDRVARECDKTGDWTPMFAALDAVRAVIPERAGQYDAQRFVIMIGLGDMPDAGYEFGRRIAKDYAQDMLTTRSLARAILNSPYAKRRDIDFAMELAVTADTLAKGEDARAADTLGLAWFSKGNREKAIENAERAVKLEKDQKTREQYEQSLQKFRTGTPGPEPTKPRPAPAAATPPVTPAATPAVTPSATPAPAPAPPR